MTRLTSLTIEQVRRLGFELKKRRREICLEMRTRHTIKELQKGHFFKAQILVGQPTPESHLQLEFLERTACPGSRQRYEGIPTQCEPRCTPAVPYTVNAKLTFCPSARYVSEHAVSSRKFGYTRSMGSPRPTTLLTYALFGIVGRALRYEPSSEGQDCTVL
jgi:hypothetical protein